MEMAEGQAVGFGDPVNMIGGDQMAGASHVVDDDGRLPRHMLAEVARDGPRISIEAAAGRSADDHADGLALVEIFLGGSAARKDGAG